MSIHCGTIIISVIDVILLLVVILSFVVQIIDISAGIAL